jgi:hypothetical protein
VAGRPCLRLRTYRCVAANRREGPLPSELPDGFPVIIAGARITIRWQDLKRFEGGHNGAPARIIYTDNGRTETVAVAIGPIGASGDSEAQSEELDNIARLDVSMK